MMSPPTSCRRRLLRRPTSRRRRLLRLTPILVAAACGGRAPAAPLPAPAVEAPRATAVDTVARPLDPARYLEVLEEHLVNRPASRVGFRITSEGAFAAALAGELRLTREGGASLDARGTFGADSVVLTLRTADGRMTGGNGTRGFDQPAPPALREALVIGMMRMGILHNLARLVAGSPPDHADGAVRSWVEVRDVAWLPRDTTAARRGLSYDLFVAGQPAGAGVLWLDGRGRPVARQLTVRFQQGEMRVAEEYEVR